MPRSIGSIERGEELLGGLYRMGGQIVDGAGLVLWDALPGAVAPLREAHGFGWLDDLAAAPNSEEIARAWTAAWIERFGNGSGPGWVADLAGRRALRLVHHGEMLAPLPLAACLDRHAAFLARRATRAASGWARVEALTGLVHAALALDSADPRAAHGLAELERAADAVITREGGVHSRSPEALARALLLLAWSADTAAAHGLEPGPSLLAALSRAAPVVRALLQPDGRLPRFHGGGAASGLGDAALAAAGYRWVAPPDTPVMGFARLRHGRTSVVLDAAPPPIQAGDAAHASTLAIEVTVGVSPMVLNCGPGRRYGPRWSRAARATASHSTLALEGFSSSRGGRQLRQGRESVREIPTGRELTEAGTRIVAAHDGYRQTHGLDHERIVELSRDGRTIFGEDILQARDAAARRCFDRVRRRSGPVRFAIRFHLDPAVGSSLDMGGRAVSLLLPSGGLWVLRAVSAETRLSLEPSVTFPPASLEPVATRQIVLFSSAHEYATRIAWKLAEAPGRGGLVPKTGW